MTEATGFEAKTIHRLLETDPRAGGFKRGTGNPLACDLLVIDETSMVDVLLIRDIQVLCPMNRGGVGARSLNIELQAALNPAGERKVERFGWTFAPGDKVMQIENDYEKEVYNGDIGYIDDVDSDLGELTASFDGRAVTYGFGELDTLVPAYAATIHKSQGSEYPAVVIPVLTQHYAMLQRNLLYTGVTRGKQVVVLVGQTKAVAIAVRNASGRRRWSKLNEWLAATTAVNPAPCSRDHSSLVWILFKARPARICPRHRLPGGGVPADPVAEGLAHHQVQVGAFQPG
jgi:ATP-dependent exoDNAse (exonuclease V) alpha subunit